MILKSADNKYRQYSNNLKKFHAFRVRYGRRIYPTVFYCIV